MNIKTKLDLTVAVSLLFLIILAITTVTDYKSIKRDNERANLASELRTTVFELNILINEYLIDPKEREVQQWGLRYNSGLLLLMQEEEEEEEEELIKNIGILYRNLDTLFFELIDQTEEYQRLREQQAPEEQITLVEANIKRKVSQVSETSQAVISSVGILRERVVARHYQNLQKVFFLRLMIISFILITSMLLFTVSKSIAKPLKKLVEANENVAKGDLNTRISFQKKDEFEILAHAFNREVSALQKAEREQKSVEEMRKQIFLNTSHELKTPLTPIIIQGEMLKNSELGPINKNQRASLKMILHNMYRLSTLINDVLEAARLESETIRLTIEECDLKEMTQNIVNQFLKQAQQRKITLKNTVSRLFVPCDQRRIEQVLLNIVNNALKFTEKGSITLAARKQKDHVLISVTDTGIGIPKESQKNIFQPFYQVKPSYVLGEKGTGLGLSICKNLIELHGGRIWVESEGTGKGSTFYFTLPSKAKRNLNLQKIELLKEG